MPKVISIQNAEIVEVVLRPSESTPLSVTYRLKDAQAHAVLTKTVTLPAATLPAAAQTAIASFVAKILQRVEQDEQIN